MSKMTPGVSEFLGSESDYDSGDDGRLLIASDDEAAFPSQG